MGEEHIQCRQNLGNKKKSDEPAHFLTHDDDHVEIERQDIPFERLHPSQSFGSIIVDDFKHREEEA